MVVKLHRIGQNESGNLSRPNLHLSSLSSARCIFERIVHEFLTSNIYDVMWAPGRIAPNTSPFARAVPLQPHGNFLISLMYLCARVLTGVFLPSWLVTR